jgi:SAM-dependent methyltransferase
MDLAPDLFTEDVLRLNRVAAERQGVESAIHAKDFMYQYTLAPSRAAAPEHAINYYFEDGALSARKLVDLIASLGYPQGQRVKLLEFASGYGCVSRHLKRFSHLDLVSCDIHQEAIEFLSSRIGVKSIISAHVPEGFKPAESFDVIFALSFFTHMPKSTFGRWLRALFGALKVTGYLVFTTHGRPCFEQLGIPAKDIPADGFWFRAGSEQLDLDTGEYGAAMTTPDFVIGEIYRQIGAPIVSFTQAGWWQQDLWVLKREK